MKNVIVSILAAAAVLAVLPVHAAGSDTATFPVNITLNTACKITTAPGAVSFSYTSFQPAASALTAPGGSFGVTCTNSLIYTVALDAAGSYTDASTNLAYTLALSSAGGTGSGVEKSYTISGDMPAGQAGSCAANASSCSNAGAADRVRTLTVGY